MVAERPDGDREPSDSYTVARSRDTFSRLHAPSIKSRARLISLSLARARARVFHALYAFGRLNYTHTHESSGICCVSRALAFLSFLRCRSSRARSRTGDFQASARACFAQNNKSSANRRVRSGPNARGRTENCIRVSVSVSVMARLANAINMRRLLGRNRIHFCSTAPETFFFLSEPERDSKKRAD